MRLTLLVAERLRRAMPDDLPLFVRVSGTDWVEGGWDIAQTVELARTLKPLGVDVIDVSSGGVVPQARIPVARGYQVPLARQVRDQAGIRTAAVGLITESSAGQFDPALVEAFTRCAAEFEKVFRELPG